MVNIMNVFGVCYNHNTTTAIAKDSHKPTSQCTGELQNFISSLSLLILSIMLLFCLFTPAKVRPWSFIQLSPTWYPSWDKAPTLEYITLPDQSFLASSCRKLAASLSSFKVSLESPSQGSRAPRMNVACVFTTPLKQLLQHRCLSLDILVPCDDKDDLGFCECC